MKMKLVLLAVVTTLSSLVGYSTAAELGDPAPALKISTWLKGQPVDLSAAKGKQVVVVEFWATWCPPCRASIPHLTELQKKFKDKGVIFVGVTDEAVAVAKPFVEKMGDQMDYTVAVDDNKQTSAGYMEAYGINGIPHAFIVDKEGRVVWNGHPMNDMEKPLSAIVEGKFDITKAKKKAEADKKLEAYAELVAEDGNEAKAAALAKELEALDNELGGVMPDGKKFNAAEVKKQIRFQVLQGQYQQALTGDKDPAAREKLAKQLQEVAPPDFKLAKFENEARLNQTFSQYFQIVCGQGDEAKLPELKVALEKTEVDNVEMLNGMAWAVLTHKRIKNREPQVALALVKKAVALSKGEVVDVLDTYARALADTGKLTEAIAQQKKAIAACKDSAKREEMEKTLKTYQETAAKK
jgi:thiol-disulfide isomerase/thioredoxin